MKRKIKIVGSGTLSHNYLIVGKVYDAEKYNGCDNVYQVKLEDEDEDIGNTGLVSLAGQNMCGYLADAEGELHWEFVE